MNESVFGIIFILVLVGLGVYSYRASNETPVVAPKPSTPTPKSTKISRANLRKLTKAQLEEKGRELGIDVDRRLLKEKIVNEVFKAQ
tara:strand:+ start:333 stop:593 length:261 start_codon:yes stop_codon:yes gene_type:complete